MPRPNDNEIDNQNDPDEEIYREGTRGWIALVRGALGDDRAFGLLLVRITRSIQATYGTACARGVLDEMKKLLEDEETKC
jgi:hypothetical protein